MKKNETRSALFLWLLFWLFFTGCSASPESDSPGQCRLECSKTVVAGAEFKIVPLTADRSKPGVITMNMACAADFRSSQVVPLGGPITLSFLVYEELPSTFGGGIGSGAGASSTAGGASGGASGGATGGAGGSGASLQGSNQLLQRVPRANIGFQPYFIGGSMAVSETNPEHKNGDQATPFKFAGVKTPKSEWCTDSCGVATFEFVPNCIQGQNNAFETGVQSGGAEITGVQVTIANGAQEN